MKLLISLCLIMIAALAAFGQSGDVKKYNSDSDVPRITVEDAKKAFDDGNAVFVDARAEDIYKQEHIKGAVIIKGAQDDRFDALPKGRKIIVYCS
ncbi:MAG TPA: rhodanese-like domain-containing protein [Pyrinomonadaceae bacterium]|nr:rhodanese-like domain-containing protein [Pyrinomonadaceae bacterium]